MKIKVKMDQYEYYPSYDMRVVDYTFPYIEVDRDFLIQWKLLLTLYEKMQKKLEKLYYKQLEMETQIEKNVPEFAKQYKCDVYEPIDYDKRITYYIVRIDDKILQYTKEQMYNMVPPNENDHIFNGIWGKDIRDIANTDVTKIKKSVIVVRKIAQGR